MVDISISPVTEPLPEKEPRCYFLYEFGKPSRLVLEIVFNKVGHEFDSKLRDYARTGIRYLAAKLRELGLDADALL